MSQDNDNMMDHLHDMFQELCLPGDRFRDVITAASDFLTRAGWKYKLAERSQPQDRLPKCPHCKIHPMPIHTRTIDVGMFRMLAVFCGSPSCLKIVGVSVVGVQQRDEAQREPLIRPASGGLLNIRP